MDNEVLFKELVGAFCQPLIVVRQFPHALAKLRECVGKSGVELLKNAAEGNVRTSCFHFLDFNWVSSLRANDMETNLLDSLRNNDKFVSETVDDEVDHHYCNFSKWFTDWCMTLATSLRIKRNKKFNIPVERNGLFVFIHQEDDLRPLRECLRDLADLRISIAYFSHEYPEDFITLMSKYTIEYCIINTKGGLINSPQLMDLVERFIQSCYERLEWNVQSLQDRVKNLKMSSKMLISPDSEKNLRRIALIMSEEFGLGRDLMMHHVIKANLDHEIHAFAELLYGVYFHRYGLEKLNEYNQVLNQAEETDRSTGHSVISHFDKAIAHYTRHNCVYESFFTSILSLLIGDNEELNKILAKNALLELTSKSDFARSALFLELSSIRCAKPKRKNFQLVMAGHLFNQAGLENLSKRCYLACVNEYEGWDVANEHLYSLLANFDPMFIINCLNIASNAYENKWSSQYSCEKKFDLDSPTNSQQLEVAPNPQAAEELDGQNSGQPQDEPAEQLDASQSVTPTRQDALDHPQFKTELTRSDDSQVAVEGSEEPIKSEKQIYYLKRLVKLKSFQSNSKYQRSTPISGAFRNYPAIYYVYRPMPKTEGVTPFLVRVPIIYLRKNGIIGTNVAISTCYVDDLYQRLLENSLKHASWQKCMKFYDIKEPVKNDFASSGSKKGKPANYTINTSLNLTLQFLNPLNVALECTGFRILLEILSAGSRNTSINTTSSMSATPLRAARTSMESESPPSTPQPNQSHTSTPAVSKQQSVDPNAHETNTPGSTDSLSANQSPNTATRASAPVDTAGIQDEEQDDGKYKWIDCEIVVEAGSESFHMEPFEKKELVLAFKAAELGSFKIVGVCWRLFDCVSFWSPVYTVGKKLRNYESCAKLTLDEFVAQRATDKTLYFNVYEQGPKLQYSFRKISDLTRLKNSVFFPKKELDYLNYDNLLMFYTQKYSASTSQLPIGDENVENENLCLFEFFNGELGLIELCVKGLLANPLNSVLLRFKVLGSFRVAPYPVCYALGFSGGHPVDAAEATNPPDGACVECAWNAINFPNVRVKEDSLTQKLYEVYMNFKDGGAGQLPDSLAIYLFVEPIKFSDGLSLIDGSLSLVPKAGLEQLLPFKLFLSVKAGPEFFAHFDYKNTVRVQVNNKSPEDITGFDFSVNGKSVQSTHGRSVPLDDGSPELAEDLGKEVVDDLSKELAVELPNDTPVDVVHDLVNDMSQDLTDQVSQELVNDMSQDLVDNVVKEVVDEVQNLPDDSPNYLPDELLDDLPDDSPNEAPLELLDDSPNDAPLELLDDSPNDAPLELLDDSPNDAPDDLPDELAQDSLDDSPQDLPDDALDDLTDELPQDSPYELSHDESSDVDNDSPVQVPNESPVNLLQDLVLELFQDAPKTKSVKLVESTDEPPSLDLLPKIDTNGSLTSYSTLITVPSKSSMNFMLPVENPMDALRHSRSKPLDNFNFSVFWSTAQRFGIFTGHVECARYKLTVSLRASHHEIQCTPEPVVVTLKLTLQNVSTESLDSLCVSAISDFDCAYSFIGATKRSVELIRPGESVCLNFDLLIALPGVYNFSPLDFKLVSTLDDKHVLYSDNVSTIILYD